MDEDLANLLTLLLRGKHVTWPDAKRTYEIVKVHPGGNVDLVCVSMDGHGDMLTVKARTLLPVQMFSEQTWAAG